MLVANESKERKSTPIEAGAYVARCVQIIDLGDQFNDLSQKYARKTMLTFELPTERVEVNGESKPRLMSKTYTLSLNEKASLRKDLESWYGRQLAGDDFPFDIRKVAGMPCMLTIVVKKSKQGNEYSTIGNISKLMKGMDAPKQETETLIFDLDDEQKALDTIENLPEWIQKNIKESPSYKAIEEKWKDIRSDELPF